MLRYALTVFAARLSTVHLDQMHQEPDIGLPLPLRMLHTNFGPNQLRTVDLCSEHTDRQTNKQIELYKVFEC